MVARIRKGARQIDGLDAHVNGAATRVGNPRLSSPSRRLPMIEVCKGPAPSGYFGKRLGGNHHSRYPQCGERPAMSMPIIALRGGPGSSAMGESSGVQRSC